MKGGLRTKVEKQPDFELRSGQIAAQLAVISQVQIVGGFHFNDDFVVNQHVEPLQRDDLVIELNGHEDFPIHFVAKLPKHARQRLDIDPFEKSISELVVDQIERSNDRLSDFPMEQFDFPFRRCHIRMISQTSAIRVTD